METNKKVQIEINCKDHDEIWLIGKSAIFIFNPNTRNGEELFDFLSCCEEIPETIKSDNTETLANALQEIEKLEADKAELLEALENILDGKKDGRTYISMDEIESLIQKHKQ